MAFFRYIAIVFVFVGGWGESLWARKTNQAVYEEPFDIAAGGAALTRASQEGVLFANPALMPYGGVFHRWLGIQSSVLASREWIDQARGQPQNEACGTAEDGGAGLPQDPGAILDKVQCQPVHFGVLQSLSYLTNNVGVAAFARMEADLTGEKFGPGGLPVLSLGVEGYGGAVASYGMPLARWFSLGVTVKKLYVAEPDISIDIADSSRIERLTNDPQALQNELSYGSGMGYDAGMLLFLQGSNMDFRWAIKADDVGDTQFTGTQPAFKQTLHTGLGLTFHGTTEAIHLSADYRDILGVYEEQIFKRIYAGARLMMRNRFGFAVGYYQGIPTAGVRLDLFFFKIGATVYGREMGDYVGDSQRNLYVVYFGTGF